MDLSEIEQLSGVRMTFSAVPGSREHLEKLQTHLAVLFTPLRPVEELTVLQRPLPKCQTCGSFYTSLCRGSSGSGWDCCFCFKHNSWRGEAPPDLRQGSLAVEFEVPDTRAIPSDDILFVVDLCQSEQNLSALKSELCAAADRAEIGEGHIRFGLIAFARSVFVYLENSTGMPRCACLPSNCSTDNLVKLIGGDQRRCNFFFSSKEAFVRAVEVLDIDPWPTPSSLRPMRATGKAVEAALAVIELAKPRHGARIALCVGGPGTASPGAISTLEISSFIRTHADIEAGGKAREESASAQAFYDSLGAKAVALQTAIDVFAFALEEVGLHEMQRMVTRTGGLMFLNEEFKQPHFSACMKRYIRKASAGANLATGGTVELFLSPELRVQGCLGTCASLENKSALQAGTEVGESRTNAWSLCGLDCQSTLLFFLEPAQQAGTVTRSHAHFQFCVTFKPQGARQRRRVVTIQRAFLTDTSVAAVLPHLDQFSLIVAYAKLTLFRFAEHHESVVVRYLDKVLVSLLRLFGSASSVPQELSLVPQYFYYLRRSQFVRKFTSSLDEMAFFRYSMLRENTDNALLIIQPQIVEYRVESETPVPVLPDIDCLKKDVVLLADTFFNVIVWQGSAVRGWLAEGYHLQPEYAHIARLATSPGEEAERVVEDRVLAPNRVEAHFGSPTERLLKSRLNPENKTLASENEATDSGNFISDDATLSAFVARLLQLLGQK